MITQRLAHGPDRRLVCPGCQSTVTSGMLQHPDDCPELQRGNTAGPLPTSDQIHAWLTVHGWTSPGGSGAAGSAWQPVDGQDWVGVPDDSGMWEMGGALERIAKRSGMPFGQVLAEMRAIAIAKRR